jgi:hypothetical protein
MNDLLSSGTIFLVKLDSFTEEEVVTSTLKQLSLV